MTVSGRNSDAILAGYRHYPRAYSVAIFREVTIKVNVKKWAAGP